MRIGETAGYRPAHAVYQVIVHLPGVLAHGQLPEPAAVAGRASVVDLEDGVAPVGKELDDTIVVPVVAGPVTAVHVEHHRPRGPESWRPGEIAMQANAVARIENDRLGRTQSVGEHHRGRSCEQNGVPPPLDEKVFHAALGEDLDGYPLTDR